MGRWIHGRVQIGDYITLHFQVAFTSDRPEVPLSMEDLIQLVLSSDDQASLVAVPTEVEIHTALFKIGPNKAPSPDGMTGLFFQYFWATVKVDPIGMVLRFFRFDFLLKELNRSLIVLLAKCDHPVRVTDFRPISLSNVAYKVIAKLMVNGMRPLMSKLVTFNQAAFVSGRSIQENSILAQELFHTMKRKTGRKGTKMDM